MFARRCRQLCITIFACLLSSVAYSFSCKVVREGKDTILSDNCIKQDGGNVLVTFCNNSGKCIASNAVEAPGYKCQTTSPGTPGFCVEITKPIQLNKQSFITFDKSMFASAFGENQDTYQVVVQNDREFSDFKNILLGKRTKAAHNLFLIYGKDKTMRAACSLDGRRLVDLASAETIPSCDSIGNKFQGVTLPNSQPQVPTSKNNEKKESD